LTARGNRRTRYRPRHLTWPDAFVMGATTVGIGSLIALSSLGDTTLRWSASPLQWPTASLLPLAALALLAAPLCVAPIAARTTGAHSATTATTHELVTA
jgi:hypothetical protein